jgi:hypothetical protein
MISTKTVVQKMIGHMHTEIRLDHRHTTGFAALTAVASQLASGRSPMLLTCPVVIQTV